MAETMKRWSQQKLDKEAYFAELANDGGPECRAWNDRIYKEYCRRKQTPPIGLSPNWQGARLIPNNTPGGF